MKTAGFTSRLITLLEVAHVTQAAVANHLGVSEGTVSAWVNGAIPHRRTAKALADIFGVNLDWLLYGKGDKLPPGRYEMHIKGISVPEKFDPPLSERSTWTGRGGLDAKALTEIASNLKDAAAALDSCAKIIARSVRSERRGRKRKTASEKFLSGKGSLTIPPARVIRRSGSGK